MSTRHTPADVLASGAPTRHLLPYLLNLVVNRTNRIWQEELREHGLTVARWQVLSILVALDGSRITTLAELAGATQPVTTRVVDQMERDGLVERRQDPDDARASAVWLTALGRRTFVGLVEPAGAMVDELTADLDEHDVEVLADLLARLLARTPGGVGPVDVTSKPAATTTTNTGARP